MLRFALALLVVGGFLALAGYRDHRLTSGSSEEPQVISCRDLGARGPGSNLHVVMTDVAMLGGSAFVNEKSHRRDLWYGTWTPAIPLDDPYARWIAAGREGEVVRPPEAFSVVVYYPGKPLGARDQDRVTWGFREPILIQGTVVNDLDSLGGDAVEHFRRRHPKIDPDRIWILEAGRRPKTGSGPLWMMIGGVGLIMSAGVLALVVVPAMTRRRDAAAARQEREHHERYERRRRALSRSADAPPPPPGSAPQRKRLRR